MTTAPIENLSKEFKRIVDGATKHNAEVIAKELRLMPKEFENAALRYYPFVLNIVSGQLKRSIDGFIRSEGKDAKVVGLRSDKDYAHVQHEGFDGNVQVPAHMRTRRGSTHSVRAHTRHMKIKPKKFLENPMKTEAEVMLKQMIKRFGFGKSK